MAKNNVKAAGEFNGFFTIGSVNRVRWIKIAEGTKGTLSEKDAQSGRYQKITFEFNDNDTASAPVSYNEDDIGKTDIVQHDRFVAA